MARLYADEHMPDGVIFALRRLGHLIDRVRDHSINKRGDGWSDETVLDEATKHRAGVITKNRKDFAALHSGRSDHFGIIVCTFDDLDDHKRIARHIDKAIRDNLPLRGKLIRVCYP